MLRIFSALSGSDFLSAWRLIRFSRKTFFDILFNWSLSLTVKFAFFTFSSTWLIAVLVPLGGQTVTSGNLSSVMGWVVMVVDTGESCHSWYELVIMLMAMAKQANTMATQTALMVWDLELEICTRPWMVELSRKLHIKDRRVISTLKNKEIKKERKVSLTLVSPWHPSDWRVATKSDVNTRAAESVAAQYRRCELSKGLVRRARMLYANSESNREPERARASKREAGLTS